MLFAIVALLLQASPCPPAAAGPFSLGEALLRRFDAPGALAQFENAGRLGCVDGSVAAAYLRGLEAAREAYAQGGSAESLAPVDAAARELETRAKTGHPSAEIALVMLMAASAAAQSERDDMTTFIDHALSLEGKAIALGVRPVIPRVTETAGDLWLQVHRFETARESYRAAAATGATAATALGLARVALRLNEMAEACSRYRELLRISDAQATAAPIVEARSFIAARGC